MNLHFTDYSGASAGQDEGFGASAGVRDVSAAAPVDVERWSSLDALPSQVAVVDHLGVVRWVNASWARGVVERHGRAVESVGLSFAHACARAMGFGPDAASAARDGLRAVLTGAKGVFEFECAHHPRGGEAWSSVTVTPCEIDGKRGALVQQVDVTDVHQADRRRVVARAVARAMGADGARREMLRDVITQVCAAMNWCVAARWSWDRAAKALRCDAVYSLRPDGSRGWGTLSNTEGLASRVWATHCPQWSESLEREDAAVVKTVLGAQSHQIVEAIGVPVGHAGHADGVVVFYSAHEHRPEAALLDMLSSLLVGGRWVPSSALAQTAREAAVAPRARDAFASVIELAAASLCTVLLTGERGTGKVRAARAIHAASGRARGPFVECNCASLTAQEFEAELFGGESGGQPEGKRARRGLLEQAAGGTLVLREVGALDAASQAKLLKVLESHMFQRLGDAREILTDVRVIATSTRDLRAPTPRKVRGFSDDLLQRLSSLVVAVPALRGREDHLSTVTRSVLADLARVYNRRAPSLGAAALAALAAHAWPGNIRELRNVLERAWLGVGDLVSPDAITAAIHGHPVPAANEVTPEVVVAPPAPPAPAPRAARPAPRAPAVEPVAQHAPAELLGAIDPTALTLADVERAHIERVLIQTGFNMRRAATALDISRSTLYTRARHYKLNVTRSRHGGSLGVENDNDASQFEAEADDTATGT